MLAYIGIDAEYFLEHYNGGGWRVLRSSDIGTKHTVSAIDRNSIVHGTDLMNLETARQQATALAVGRPKPCLRHPPPLTGSAEIVWFPRECYLLACTEVAASSMSLAVSFG